MTTVVDPLSRVDYLNNVQYEAREYPVPRFGKPQEIRGGNPRPVRSIAFNCNGKKAATGCDTRGLRVWDVRDKMDAATTISIPTTEKTSPHDGHITSVAWSPADPNILISGDKSSSTGPCIAIWDISKPKTPIFSTRMPNDVLHISFRPDGAHFAVVCSRPQRDEVHFFHRVLVDGAEKWVKREDIIVGGRGEGLGAEEINSLRFSNSGQYVCAVGNDGSLNAWYYPTALVVPKLDVPPASLDSNGGEAGPSRSSTQKDRNSASTPKSAANGGGGAEKGDVEMADGADGNGDNSSGEPSGLGLTTDSPISGVVARSAATVPPPNSSRPSSPSSRSDKAKSSSTTIPPQQLRRIKHSLVHSAALLALGLDPTGKFMAVGGQDALVSVFSTKDWICARTFDNSTGAIRQIDFSPDGELIAFTGEEQAIYIVSVYSGQQISKIPIPYNVNALAWHPTKNWLAYSVTSKGVIMWYMVHQE